MGNDNTNNEHLRAVGLLVATATLWSFGGILIKLVNWNPVAIAGMRSGIASLLILTVIKKPKWSWNIYKSCGVAAYILSLILFVTASKLTTAANAILLQYTAPVYIAIFGKFILNEKTEGIDWLFIGVIVSGMLLFFLDDLDVGSIKGNILAILCGVAFAFNIMFIRKQKDENPVEIVFWGNIFTFIISVPFMFKSMPDSKGWVGLILLGVVQIGFSYILYVKAIKNVTALEGVLIPMIEPILNPLWVFVFIGEKPGKWALIGGIIVLVAVTLRTAYTVLKTIKYKNISA
ncbi:EamA family transporter [Clostridium bovifaecis]|uniref:EamA family transporter n=1 Tax=Clostridium bovifaecis TaxID=2184719 RepID=A0A6I6EV71_9CLOT|nr:EamA family transporter [Clostridium bovifaecis]